MVECTKLTAQEMMDLKPNMRREVGCPRGRWPAFVELERNGELLYRGEHAPSGLWNDGPSTVFKRFDVQQGPQELTVRLRDSGRAQGFDYEQSVAVDLAPEQNFVIEFRSGEGFIFH